MDAEAPRLQQQAVGRVLMAGQNNDTLQLVLQQAVKANSYLLQILQILQKQQKETK